MSMEPTYVELKATIKIGMGEYLYKGQRFRKPFPDAIEKEYRTNPGIFLVLDQAPSFQSNTVLSAPKYKSPPPANKEPTEEDRKAVKELGEMAHAKAKETREMIEKMVEEKEKPSRKRRLKGK